MDMWVSFTELPFWAARLCTRTDQALQVRNTGLDQKELVILYMER